MGKEEEPNELEEPTEDAVPEKRVKINVGIVIEEFLKARKDRDTKKVAKTEKMLFAMLKLLLRLETSDPTPEIVANINAIRTALTAAGRIIK